MDYRLKRQCDFNELFHKGKRCYTKSLTIIYLSKNCTKVGISVSKKHGNAVQRNRIKRLIRAVYIPYLEKIKNYYIVILPKVANEYSYQSIFDDVSYLLKKEKLINEENFVENN